MKSDMDLHKEMMDKAIEREDEGSQNEFPTFDYFVVRAISTLIVLGVVVSFALFIKAFFG